MSKTWTLTPGDPDFIGDKPPEWFAEQIDYWTANPDNLPSAQVYANLTMLAEHAPED